jgi:hypothetical protein
MAREPGPRTPRASPWLAVGARAQTVPKGQADARACQRHESVRQRGALLRGVFACNERERNFRVFCLREPGSRSRGMTCRVVDKQQTRHDLSRR